jgi:hypothetical protein
LTTGTDVVGGKVDYGPNKVMFEVDFDKKTIKPGRGFKPDEAENWLKAGFKIIKPPEDKPTRWSKRRPKRLWTVGEWEAYRDDLKRSLVSGAISYRVYHKEAEEAARVLRRVES